jgi:hypothetical protein
LPQKQINNQQIIKDARVHYAVLNIRAVTPPSPRLPGYPVVRGGGVPKERLPVPSGPNSVS